MREKLTYYFQKTVKVIRSCESEEQLLAAKKMIINFTHYWKNKGLDTKTLDHYLIYLSVLYNSKKISLRYE